MESFASSLPSWQIFNCADAAALLIDDFDRFACWADISLFNFNSSSTSIMWAAVAIAKLDVTLNCQAVFVALFFFFLLLFFCQLWNSKTRRDFELPDNFHCHEGLCHGLLQVATDKFWNVIFIYLLISNKFFWISFGHEIGHNFGADHNRESRTVAPYEDAYGHWIKVGTWWKHDQIFLVLYFVHNLRYSYIANGGSWAGRLQNYHGVQWVRPLHQGDHVHCSTLSLFWHDTGGLVDQVTRWRIFYQPGELLQ